MEFSYLHRIVKLTELLNNANGIITVFRATAIFGHINSGPMDLIFILISIKEILNSWNSTYRETIQLKTFHIFVPPPKFDQFSRYTIRFSVFHVFSAAIRTLSTTFHHWSLSSLPHKFLCELSRCSRWCGKPTFKVNDCW